LNFVDLSPGYGFVKLEGSTKQSDRQPSLLHQWLSLHISIILGMPMIDKFQKDPKVFIFLISTFAGGTGLNLTGNILTEQMGQNLPTVCQVPTRLLSLVRTIQLMLWIFLIAPMR